MLTVLYCGLPIFFIYFFTKNMYRWQGKDFQDKYGALLDGTNPELNEKQWIVILIPTSYFVRRLAMCSCLIFWKEFFWGQVAI